MLHATYIAGKSNRYKVYQGYRDEQTRHVHEEDEITSTVLGPLDFLSPSAIHVFWRTVFGIAGYGSLLPVSPPDNSRVVFWDSRMARNGGLRIEPDGRVDLFWNRDGETQQQTLLIEVKWRAPLSGDNQLHRQWCDYLTDEEQPITHHVFIGIETSAGLAALHSTQGDVWNGRLVLLNWLQMRAAFSELSCRDDELGRWARLADRFLERVGIRRFLGFGDCLDPTRTVAAFEPPIFWQRFSPWTWVSRLKVFSVTAESRVFWFN